VGHFTFSGHFIDNSSQLEFTKQYQGAHKIFYKGDLNPANDSEVTGYWGFSQGMQNGKFRLNKL
jgi:hypothetical protein